MKKRKAILLLPILVALLLIPATFADHGLNQSGSSGVPDTRGMQVPATDPVKAVLEIPHTVSIITVTSRGTDQDSAAIWEDRIVWVDRRNYEEDDGVYQSDIYLYDIPTGVETRITTTPYDEVEPDIWGDLIVWQVYGWDDDSSEIHLFNLSSREDTCITHDFINQVKPRIWGERIVWQEFDEWDTEMGVILYDIPSQTMQTLGSILARSPSIWEDRVIWEDSDDGADYDIFLYNITSGHQIRIAADPSPVYPSSIWDDRIVWQDHRNGAPQIYLYNVTTGTEMVVTNIDHPQENPAVSGDYIAFTIRKGNDKDIYLVCPGTLQEGTITQDTTGSAKFNPGIWGDRIIWTDRRHGDSDIFLSTVGISLPDLIASFHENTSQGQPPLTIAFTDTTTGTVSGWLWDFGDGNVSMEQNPVHQYLTPGSYSVTLIVHNFYQRDAITKPALVSVGTTPVPDFFAGPVSGSAPLEVMFQDRSSGIPVQWRWEFGDGTYTDEQNPVHTYPVAGVYTVNLTVMNVFGSASIEKKDLISARDATRAICTFPSEGITTTTVNDNILRVLLNITSPGTWNFDPGADPTRVRYNPPKESGFAELELVSSDQTGFSVQGYNLLTGNLSRTIAQSSDIHPRNFSTKIGDTCLFNFTLSYSGYPSDGCIRFTVFEGATPEDYLDFERVAAESHYNAIQELAYTVLLSQENLTSPGPASLIFAVSSDWVRQYGWGDNRSLEIDSVPPGARVYVDTIYAGLTPVTVGNLTPGSHEVMLSRSGYETRTVTMEVRDERDSIHVIRIGDDGSGEVLNTTFIGHDPERNLDFFRAESPHGLSTFGLASLSKSGNVFQMIYLFISGVVSGGGGGGGGGGSPGRSPDWLAAAVITPTPVTTPVQDSHQSPLPVVTSQGDGETTGTPVPGPTDTIPDGGNAGINPPGVAPWGPATMVLMKNLAVVSVVILVTAIFYLRWQRREQ